MRYTVTAVGYREGVLFDPNGQHNAFEGPEGLEGSWFEPARSAPTPVGDQNPAGDQTLTPNNPIGDLRAVPQSKGWFDVTNPLTGETLKIRGVEPVKAKLAEWDAANNA